MSSIYYPPKQALVSTNSVYNSFSNYWLIKCSISGPISHYRSNLRSQPSISVDTMHYSLPTNALYAFYRSKLRSAFHLKCKPPVLFLTLTLFVAQTDVSNILFADCSSKSLSWIFCPVVWRSGNAVLGSLVCTVTEIWSAPFHPATKYWQSIWSFCSPPEYCL